MTPTMTDHQKTDAFFDALEQSVANGSLIELLLTKYRGTEVDLNRVLMRRVNLKGRPHLSLVYRYKTRDITKNEPVDRGVQQIRSWLGHTFLGGHLFTETKDWQIDYSKKGKVTLGTSAPSRVLSRTSQEHDKPKHRFVDSSRPFLRTLGITQANGHIVPAMARKWKQINKFIEIFEHAVTSSDLAQQDTIRVVDFGSGKGYLTFAIFDYLRSVRGVNAQVTGVELREELVNLCSNLAVRLNMDGLHFRVGDVRSSPPEAMDALIALHACDTATDLAIYLGICSNAQIIMCSPCCHKEIRSQIQSPANLLPVLKYGVHMGQEADMVTDALRALLLEAHGYKTQILEFVSLEHTSKNKLILAIRGSSPVSRDEILGQIRTVKTTYGITKQTLEMLLQRDARY